MSQSGNMRRSWSFFIQHHFIIRYPLESSVERDDNGLSLDSPVLTSLVAGLSSSLERSVSIHLAEALFLKPNHFLDISTFVENLDCPSSLLINVIKKLSGKIHLVKKKINSRDRMVKDC